MTAGETAPWRIGTRSSRLAQWQTASVIEHLRALLPGQPAELVALSSPGDRDLATDLRASPPDFFTRDLDDALRAGAVDAAVHSAKDLPSPMPDDIDWCWLPWHEDPRDVLVCARGRTVAELPSAPRVGISSARRDAWCQTRFPAAKLLPIRGTIEQRLAQLDAGAYDFVIMAAAALKRLGLADRISEWIDPAELPPPEGQGVLALTFRAGDARFLRLRSLFVKAVTLAGAGAGSAGECTQWTVRALQHADVCLYDALLDPNVLEFLPPGAQRVDVGKRFGRPSPRQADICRQLTLFARQGRRIVRLKGGDPGIFGRLAEELDALDALHLPYRVIPGVSSIQTATTGTGMLLTRRGLSRGFTAITPRLQGGGLAPVDAAARAALPIVILMGLHALDPMLEDLRRDGRPGTTPAAVVYGAGTDAERIVEATLATLRAQLAASGEADDGLPGLLIVGEVAPFRHQRGWGALEGRRILLTGSEALQDASADLVHDYGGIPVQRPLVRLVAAEAAAEALHRLAMFDWVTVTSPSAVRCLMQLVRREGLDLRRLPRFMAAGAGTARALARHHLAADLVPPGKFSAESLLASARGVVGAGQRVLRLRSDKAGPSLAEALRQLGAEVEDVVLYRNEPIRYERLPGFDAVFFASASAVEAFEESWGLAPLAGKTVVAIGKPTQDALDARAVPVDLVGPEATVEASLSALAALCVRRRLA
jgi:uroporphyrinogen III methyltransferase/synthase